MDIVEVNGKSLEGNQQGLASVTCLLRPQCLAPMSAVCLVIWKQFCAINAEIIMRTNQ
jgi:hypothetical protein